MLSRARAGVRELGRAPAALLCVAALCVAAMYCGNSNWDGDPAAARGDGRYRPILARGDGHMHFLITRSIVFDHDLDTDNDLARFGDPWFQPRTVTGHKNVMQQIGPSLIWAPLLAVAHGAALIANLFGAGIATHGYTMFHQRILFASSVAFAWLAIGLGVWLAARTAGGRWGPAWGGVAVLLGTPLTYYATFMPSYAHAMDAAACAGFLALWAATLGRTDWRRFVWLGVLLGIATMVRIQDVAFGVVLALELVVRAVDRARAGAAREIPGLVLRGAACLAVVALVFTPQLYEWKQMYGAYVTTPQGPGQMRYAHPMVSELLFSPRNGWLSNTPIAYLGVIGLAIGCALGNRVARPGARVRLICGAFLLAVAAQVYVNATTYEWWSGASFGQRRMCSSSLPLVVGVAVLLRAAHVWLRARVPVWAEHAIAALTLGYLVVWNLSWVSELAHGVVAGRDNVPTCCEVSPVVAWAARPVYAVVGNPFELPASAVFAAEHHTSLAGYDRAPPAYPLVPPVLGYLDGSYRFAHATWNLATPGGEAWIMGGFGPPQRYGVRAWRWTIAPRASALVPLLMPEPHRITVPIAANVAPGQTLAVTVRCDGEVVAHADVGPAWTQLAFDIPGRLGDNEIEFDAEPQPYRAAAPGATPADVPTPPPLPIASGVAIGPFQIALPPSPARRDGLK